MQIRNSATVGHLYRHLDGMHSKDMPARLIIKVGQQDKVRQSLDSELEKVLGVGGEIKFFEYIPYAELIVPAYAADTLAKRLIVDGPLYSRENVPLVTDMDVSHTFFIPEKVHELGTQAARELIRAYSGPAIQSDTDSDMPSQRMWNLRNVDKYAAEDEWGDMGQGIRVGVIDTGCDYRHDEIKSRFDARLLGYNFVANNSDPMDGNSHGTHCAGTIAGRAVGVSPNVSLYAIKVLTDEGSGSESDVIRGIEWCIKNEIHVGSMSLGSSAASQAFEDVCVVSRKKGLFLVAAAGNSYFGKSYPAAYECVASTAAVDKDKNHASFSNIDNTLSWSAPGVKVLSCIPGGGYARYSGTSMATPHAAGVLAGALSLFEPEWDADGLEDFIQMMKESCDPCVSSGSPMIDKGLYGAGHINLNSLLRNLSGEYL